MTRFLIVFIFLAVLTACDSGTATKGDDDAPPAMPSEDLPSAPAAAPEKCPTPTSAPATTSPRPPAG